MRFGETPETRSSMTSRPLISCEELAARLGAPNLRVVDASWHLPQAGRDARAEYNEARVPGARHYDIDVEAAPGKLPHMLPARAAFASGAGRLGIAPDDDIVIYDAVGLFSAARVRWVFRHFGARRVSLLDGGLPKWMAEGFPLECGAVDVIPSATSTAAAKAWSRGADANANANTHANTNAHANAGTYADAESWAVARASDVLRASDDGTAQIVDARPWTRFTAEEQEARDGVRSGHVPNSISLPFSELLDDGRLRSNEALASVFAHAGVALDRPIITTCGSGVTAAVVSLALECLGKRDVRLYDGSWAEWGSLPTTPVDQGP